jgi:hypothetical protein
MENADVAVSPSVRHHFTEKFSGGASPDFANISMQPFVKPAFVQGGLRASSCH